MNLVPSERAVLGMIRTLVVQSKSFTHRVTVLRGLWPPMHADAYDTGYVGLIAKRLVQVSPDKQTFRVTSSGLALLGLQNTLA